MPMPKLIRILAVDGGGVGGIIPSRIIERLHAENPRLIERADLVAGTSTGGLIALGLALGKTPSEMCNFYREKAKSIFSAANRRLWVMRLFRAKYRAAGLRQAVNEIAPGKILADVMAKPVFVPVVAIGRPDNSHYPAGVFLSTAYRLAGDSSLEKYASSRWKCVDVALATAAAPTYFPAHEVDSPDPNYPGKWVCWDGGVVANNPALAAVGEVYRLDFESRHDEYDTGQALPPEVRVLSLGTGYRNIDIGGGDWGPVQAARPLVGTLLDTSVGSTAFLLRQILGSRAVRVNAKLMEDYEIDDAGVIERLDAIAADFVKTGLDAVDQPDKTHVNLRNWLKAYWYDDPAPGPVAASAAGDHVVPLAGTPK